MSALDVSLLPCPFCGTEPTMERWHGGGPEKRLIGCDNEDCDVAPSVTGETPVEATERWNRRDAPASVQGGAS